MSQIIKRPPLVSSLAELQQTINRLFDPTLIEQEDGFSNLLNSDWIPTIDVKDAGSHFLITADIPGVDPKKIDVSMDNNILTIKGQKETKTKEERKNYVRYERSKGTFCRSISLPDVVDAGKISAKTKNGVLEIIAPKNKQGTKRSIKVK
ncbi:Spore protein SP21 [Aquicella siphonis]|uniref:Spore protein SP21 n=1 Tax=Aquicella siphonis TaxID=254247 RepID=A0A5E4PGM7_9COXI|nr:Hsp20/alpha crystallin family protein [Aquicella siphonis]VVC75678.1 Spore protein SP21 [Aquicella siphonis]